MALNLGLRPTDGFGFGQLQMGLCLYMLELDLAKPDSGCVHGQVWIWAQLGSGSITLWNASIKVNA